MPVQPERITTYLSGYFLGGITAVFSNLAYMLGPGFYFLFYLFPVDIALLQASADWNPGVEIVRINGLSTAGGAIYFFMMFRFGIRGIFDVRKPWRLPCFLLAVFLSLFGGFRSLLITYAVQFCIQFYFEGLVRTRLCLILALGGIAGGALLVPFLPKLPMSIQRSVAFIPGIPVSAVAKIDAEGSTRWRVEMWQVMIPQIPKYLVLGKGYALNPADLYLASQAELRGLVKNYEVSLVAGSYHSGPLSVIIPFGISGVIGFLWLLGAGLWVLYRNYRFGDPALQGVNTFLLAYFIMRIVIFLFIFGAVDSDFVRFTSILGLSVAINRGVRKPADAPALEAAGLNLQPATA